MKKIKVTPEEEKKIIAMSRRIKSAVRARGLKMSRREIRRLVFHELGIDKKFDNEQDDLSSKIFRDALMAQKSKI